jgi:amino acid transporter
LVYLLDSTAPVFWLFFLLTGIALFVLRRKHPDVPRPFSVPLYPVLPLVYCLCCAGMLTASLAYDFEEAQRLRMTVLMLVALAVGFPLYLISSRYVAKRRIPIRVTADSVLPSPQESTSLPG